MEKISPGRRVGASTITGESILARIFSRERLFGLEGLTLAVAGALGPLGGEWTLNSEIISNIVNIQMSNSIIVKRVLLQVSD